MAGLAPGSTATLAAGTVGYEWDEDLDNGARPAGLVRLSATAAFGVEKLLDYGSTYGFGNATHHLTLYRDPNGAGPDALVFGSGTVQWSWGLDGEHDRGGSSPSLAMQQATVNLFADMAVQPPTPHAGLTAASASTDSTAPVSTPATATRTVTAGTPVTVSGTAADAGGGRVGGVEVSVDGGASWHPATGRESWSFTWTPTASGQATVRSRAADDSGNLEGREPGTGPGGGLPPSGGAPPATGVTPPSGGPTAATDRVGPRVRIRPRRVRASRRGLIRLRVSCPPAEVVCRVRLRLSRAGAYVTRRKALELRGGSSRAVAMRLTPRARARLLSLGSFRVTAVATARDLAANTDISRTPIRVLAPRRR